ncbi:NAD-dependent epimerase/dehydratase family protein [Weissella confusa]|uniref:NAD-dependent epimerase/dehydratase family protein n=1 Tax=Weissella confusa TaxID=1583 RepID=UPI00143684AA|nr:NAD-dependent epimerase/dehydratase family protein [Weissella confusa]MBJ7658587.1 NAD-dependent epimerase/dehydratase family protein [Weissella confusa]
MKVLVTGGAGFIGSHVVEEYQKEGHEIVVVDDLSMGSLTNIQDMSGVTFYQESIANFEFMEKLLVTEKFDVIYLLAAIASVADTIARPYESHQINQEANLFILETIRANNLEIKKLLFASSAAVYGNLPELPKMEVSPVAPATAYAIDKYATERFVLSYAELYGIPATAVRFFNVFGPRQNPASPYSGVLSIIADTLRKNETFTLMGDGRQTRDFVFVKDVVRALRILETTDGTDGQVYNVATGHSRQLLEAIETFEKVSGKKLRRLDAPRRTGDIQESVASIDKLEKLNFSPAYSFESGVRLYWESLE